MLESICICPICDTSVKVTKRDNLVTHFISGHGFRRMCSGSGMKVKITEENKDVKAG